MTAGTRGAPLELEYLIKEAPCRKNTCSANALQFEHVRTLVAGDKIICFDCFGVVEQEAIGGVEFGERLSPHTSPAQVVDQDGKTMWL